MKILAILIALAVVGSSTAGSKPSYSGGRPSYSSSKPSYSSGSKPSYSGGSKPTASKPSYSGGKPAKPSSNFDQQGSKGQMRAESRQAYQKATSSKTEYTTSSGKTVKIDPRDAKIEKLRGKLDHQKWVNRDLRQQQFYGGYYSRPVVFYHDPYPSFFWWWLLDRSLNDRAMWAYNHQHEMDQSRLRDLYTKDAQLEARVKQLEAEKRGVRDTSYVPQGMDADLMYSNEYVDAVYNPVKPASNGWKIFWWVIGAVFFVFLIWFVFVRRIA